MKANLIEAIKRMQARVTLLGGVGCNTHLLPELTGVLKQLCENKETSQEQCQRLMASWDDPKLRRELCEVRVQTVNNFIRAEGNFLSNFFTEVPLGPADRPAIQNETMNEISVGYISQDGRARSMKPLAPQSETLIPLRTVGSERVGYFLQDIYNGNVAPAAQRTFDIAWDLTFKIDRLAKAMLEASLVNGGVYGAFTVTGNRQDRVYVPHSGIITANLPPTNDIVLSNDYISGSSGPKWFEYWDAAKYNGAESTTTSNKFRLDVPNAVNKYCNSWGNLLGGPIRPTGVIIVPSGDSTGLVGQVSPTGPAANSVAEGLLHNYQTIPNYLGVNWVLVPDATLPAGTCYPILNRPVGYYYTKSSMDMEEVDTQRSKNWEERAMTKVVGFAIPSPHRPYAVRVTYAAS